MTDGMAQQKNNGASADAKGKAFELYFAQELHPEKCYPEHYRSAEDQKPENIAIRLKTILGEDCNNIIKEHASSAVKQYREWAHNNGYLDKAYLLQLILWTSRKSDHEKFTGVKDKNCTADIMFMHTGPVGVRGISLKYSASIGLRNPGMTDMVEMTGASNGLLLGYLNSINVKLNDSLHTHIPADLPVSEKHRAFKIIAKSETHPGYAEAQSVIQYSRSIREALAEYFSIEFNKLPIDQKIITIRKLSSSEKTVYPYDRILVSANGEAYITNPCEDFDVMNSLVKEYKAEPVGSSINLYAYVQSDERYKLLSLSVKHKGSSPYTSLIARVKEAPGMSEILKLIE